MKRALACGWVWGLVALGGAGVAVMSGCENKITEANYAQIKPGMTIEQVEAILGPGERQEVGGMSISGAGVAGGAAINSQATYLWKSRDMTITVVCEGGKVLTVYKQ